MNVVEFLSAEELLAAVEDESTVATRFPVRFIVVSGFLVWSEVLEALSGACATVRLSPLCAGDDLLPHVANLRSQLQDTPEERLLVLPYGELLRLSPDLAPTKSLATWEAVGRKRVYVPVVDAEETLREQLQGVGRYRGGECSVWRIEGEGDVDVRVTPFAIKCPGRRTVRGVQAYLEMWEQAGTARTLLVTSLAPHLEDRYGLFQFTVSRTAHAVMCSQIVGGDRLDSRWGSEEQWEWLAKEARPGETLDGLAGRQLNMLHYVPDSLLTTWQQLSPRQRWLAWVWARSRPRVDSFSDIVLRDAGGPADVPAAACLGPLRHELSLEQLKQRRTVLRQWDVREMPPTFWDEFEQVADPLKRLSSLPGVSNREREQVVREVGRLVGADVAEDKWLPYVRVCFHDLWTYLTSFPYADGYVRAYMRAYTRSKVADGTVGSLTRLSQEWAEEKRIWSYPTRASVLPHVEESSARVLWVDALGVEWLGLLHELLNNERVEATLAISRAELPTSTSYNKGWSQSSEVERELDKIAHAVDYSYPEALVRQLNWIHQFASDVRAACQSTPLIVVTSDHGLTRLASRGRKLPVPDGFTAHKWGRYATGTSATIIDAPQSDDWVVYQGTLVLARHGLFQGGSSTHGEVHGGATLEESLVPVLTVRLRTGPCPKASLVSDMVRLDTRGRGRLLVDLDRPVGELRLAIGQQVFDGQRERGNRWVLALNDLKTGWHCGRLEYEKGAIGEIRFQTNRGLVEDDMGL